MLGVIKELNVNSHSSCKWSCSLDLHFMELEDTQNSLYKNLEKLNAYGYYRVLYCNDNIVVTNAGKPISECLDCNIIDVERL